jgi:hypothetical protein
MNKVGTALLCGFPANFHLFARKTSMTRMLYGLNFQRLESARLPVHVYGTAIIHRGGQIPSIFLVRRP